MCMRVGRKRERELVCVMCKPIPNGAPKMRVNIQ